MMMMCVCVCSVLGTICHMDQHVAACEASSVLYVCDDAFLTPEVCDVMWCVPRDIPAASITLHVHYMH